MLIDEFLPSYDFVETHSIDIDASAERIYESAQDADFSDSRTIRTLLFLRGMSPQVLSFRNLRRSKFQILAEREPKEIVIGLAGRFWLPWGDLQDVNTENFRQFETPGYAKAAWNFSLEPQQAGAKLTTETRIKCFGNSSRRFFGFYWTFIQPFSGWIRTEMLRSIKNHAESTS